MAKGNFNVNPSQTTPQTTTPQTTNTQNSGPLGPKGRPKRIRDAVKDTNPNYHKGRQWQENCQRCVYAYEMQRRGYDVEAMPKPHGDTLCRGHNWAKVMQGQTTTYMPSRNTKQAMLNQMAQWGEGARAVVKVIWKGHRYGHVFIAEQRNGGTIFLDPQTGHFVNIDTYLSQCIHKETELSRIDDKTPTSLILQCCQKRKKSSSS